jgi:hypothetical protein
MRFPSYASGESCGFASVWGLFWGLLRSLDPLIDNLMMKATPIGTVNRTHSSFSESEAIVRGPDVLLSGAISTKPKGAVNRSQIEALR